MDGRAFQPQVGVPPLVAVIVVDVHAAGIGHLPVHNHYLPVIAAVQPEPVVQEAVPGVGETLDRNARVLHFPVIGPGNMAVGKAFMDVADRDAFPRPGNEKVPDFPASFVVPKAEIFNVDVLLGSQDIPLEQLPLAFPRGDDFQGIARSKLVAGISAQQKLRQRPIGLLHLLHGTVRKDLGGQLRWNLFPETLDDLPVQALHDAETPIMHPAKQVKDEAHNGDNGYEQQPGYLPAGVSVVQQDKEHNAEIQHGHNDNQYDGCRSHSPSKDKDFSRLLLPL